MVDAKRMPLLKVSIPAKWHRFHRVWPTIDPPEIYGVVKLASPIDRDSGTRSVKLVIIASKTGREGWSSQLHPGKVFKPLTTRAQPNGNVVTLFVVPELPIP